MSTQPSTKLVRRTLFFTLGLSVLANVGHTLLADSQVPVWLRMIGAIAWPVLVFLGVDITVKTAWDAITGRRGGIWLARLLILVPGIPAGITSYEHMHAVLLAMGERPFIAAIGPGAVDLMMIGCTITLVLLQRVPPAAPEFVTPKIIPPGAGIMDQMVKQYRDAFEDQKNRPAEFMSTEPKVRQSSRAPRNPGQQEKAIEMMMAGQGAEAVERGLMGASTMRRYQRAERILRTNPGAYSSAEDIAAEKVRPELIGQIRGAIAAEQVTA